ncbi:MAG: DUF4252 domain-containing protein [Saprospiraceae bacterium]|nr:DUF4252 domain-containing protein [Saprospiraceae bacterium]MCB9322223.1 DUF4252 domain-containing protein [Lewinellaceae bacterium]
MKNILIIALAFLFIVPAFGQTKSINKFYNKYKHQENVTDVKVRGWLIKLASSQVDDEQAENILKKVSQLRVLVVDGFEGVKSNDYNKLIKDVEKDSFEEILRIREGTDNIRAMVKSDGDKISNVLLFVDGEDQFVMLSLEGNLNFSDLNDLHFDVEGGDAFEKIPEEKPKA